MPRITFGIIVFNGEPFTRYCLKALYPFAHEIIVVEGACEDAAHIATPDGHSTDGTLGTLYRFKEKEDPENKVQIVIRNGFWKEKHESSQAYAVRATGDYLWQVDIDEFYQPEDMRAVLEMLREDPEITAVSFKQITFWGGFDYTTDGWYLRRGAGIYHRLFKWGPGFQYVTHRPPTVHDPKARDLRTLKWLKGERLARHGIYLYHYSLVFPTQVIEKCEYYSRAAWANRRGARAWVESNFLALKHPFRVHNVYDYPSWVERFRGRHPPQIEILRQNIRSGALPIELRNVSDVERLLDSPAYKLGRGLLKMLDYGDRGARAMVRAAYRSARVVLGLVKSGLKQSFHLVGLDVRRRGTLRHAAEERSSLHGLLRQIKNVGWSPSTIIDVGAAYGSFTRECLGVFPDAGYRLIEPLAEYKPSLEELMRSAPNVKCELAIAAAQPGEKAINVHPDLVGSSLYREAEEHSGVNGVPRIVRAITVDDVMRETGAKGPFLLKIDVQGAELDVLRGAEGTLRETEYILLEVSFFKFFENGPDFYDVITHMKSKGFVPYDLYGLQYRPLDDSLSQVDIAFVKEGGAFRRHHFYATPEQREAQNRQIRDHLRRLADGMP